MWAKVHTPKKQSAFTIVELLIVIVVIGILAAITIVAYNGIQGRAKVAALQSDTTNAMKAIEVFKASSSTSLYPTSLAQAGVTASSGTTPTFVSYGSGKGCCVQMTNSTGTAINYFATNMVKTKEGVCTTLTNVITNPSLEQSTTPWGIQWFGNGGGAGTATRTTDAARCGTYGYRKAWTAAGGGQDIGFNYLQPITAGKTYAFAISVRSSYATSSRFWVDWRNSSGASLANDSATFATTYPHSANEWRDLTMLLTAPAGAVNVQILWGPYPGSGDQGAGVTVPIGATVDTDCLMVAESNYLSGYADGDSANWTWVGTPHNSTSSGSPY